jgi:hypothetical protein
VHTARFWNRHQRKRLENLIFFKISRPNIPEKPTSANVAYALGMKTFALIIVK